MDKDSPKTVSRSAFAFLSGTVLSRISGMLRDIATAFCFGSSPAISAFLVSFRFANLLRRLLGEGPLPSGFVPHFESLKKDSPHRAKEFFRDSFFSLASFLFLLLIILEGALLFWYFSNILNPDNQQILLLSILILPGSFFICLYGLSSAFLQCEKKFFLSGFAPVVFNFVWIMGVFYFKDSLPSRAMVGLSLCIVLAFFLQWLFLVPKIISLLKTSLSFKEIGKFRLFSEEVKKILQPFFLGILGIGATQINSALDAIFARAASLEGPAYLWYAIRLEQLPLALFGVALSSALLPPLSRAISEGDLQQYKDLLRFSLQRSFCFIFPCSIAIFVLGLSSVNLIFGRGDFGSHSIYHTTICLWGYSLGLLPSVFVLLLAPAFYAQKNFSVPAFISILSVIFNVALNALFVFIFKWGALSIAIATSLCAFFNYAALSYLLSKKIGKIFTSAQKKSFLQVSFCSVLAGGLTLAIGHFLVKDATLKIFLQLPFGSFPSHFTEQFLHFFILCGFFALIFLSYSWMFNIEEVLSFIGVKKKKQMISLE